ncbi:MAG: bifunctional riboflavin kinase/FAD synthetase [bacterium]|nr:bifunctional riboflavin kinase/FAD synthetase [bacterium]
MRILDSLAAFDRKTYVKPVVALGNFDGVHLGHQVIFQQVVSRAREIGGVSAVLTFEPHPLQVIAPDKAPPLLTTFEQKMRLIADLGIEVGLCVPFTETFAKQKPVDFIRDVLCATIAVHDLVVGYDFRFGHQRVGTTALLEEHASDFGYQVAVVPPKSQAGIVVSSSNIRHLLSEGEVDAAARLLGRCYAIEGVVVEGFRRGASLGFPTANVQSVNAIVPRTGVYAVRVCYHQRHYPGVANVGFNPTFGNDALSVEAHLFDFNEDLYGATVEVEFMQRIRGERKFASVEELVAQITCDAQQGRVIHAEWTKGP